MARTPSPLPPRADGTRARRAVLSGVVDSEHEYVAAAAGDSRFAHGEPIPVGTRLSAPVPAWYYPRLDNEPDVPFEYTVVHADTELVVVDKPSFLPTTPNGRLVRNTLQARVTRDFGPDCVPIHRLDRLTSGLVVCSRNPATRGRYQELFARHQMAKRYQARVHNPEVLPTRWTAVDMSLSRIPGGRGVRPDPRGTPTRTYIRRHPGEDLAELKPVTGFTHQLRAVLSAVGASISGDDTYPVDRGLDLEDFSRPLALRAVRIAFPDPIAGGRRSFSVS